MRRIGTHGKSRVIPLFTRVLGTVKRPLQCILLLAILIAVNDSNTKLHSQPPDEYLRYLAYLDSLQSVEMLIVTTLGKPKEAQSVSAAGTLSFFAREQIVYFRSDSEFSRTGEVVKVQQDALLYSFNEKSRMGLIRESEVYWPLTPLSLVGLNVGHYFGDETGTHLWNLVDKSKFSGKIASFGGVGFVIVDPFGNPMQSRLSADLIVEIDPNHQDCPMKVSVKCRDCDDPVPGNWGELGSPHPSDWHNEVIEFAFVNGIWIPSRVQSRGPGNASESTATNIAINHAASTSRRFEFPPDSVWTDQRDGSVHGDLDRVTEWHRQNRDQAANPHGGEAQEQLKEQTREAERSNDVMTIRKPWENQGILLNAVGIGAFVLIILLIPMRLAYKRWMAVWLIGHCFFIVGCDLESSKKHDAKPLLVRTDDNGPIDVRFTPQDASKFVSIQFMNASKELVCLPDSILTTCGCTLGKWNVKEAAPNEFAVLELEIAKPQFDSPRNVSAKSKVLNRTGEIVGEVEAYIQVRQDQNWRVRDRSLVLEHEFGKVGRGRLIVEIPGMDQPVIDAISDVANLLETTAIDTDWGRYELVFECLKCDSLDRDTELGSVRVEWKGGVPASIDLPVRTKLKLPYKLSHRVFVLPRISAIELALNNGWTLDLCYSTSPSISVSIEEREHAKQLSIKSDGGEFQRCQIVCQIVSENHRMTFEIPVLNTVR